MGNYEIRKGYLQAWQMKAAEMMFRGMSDKEIAKELFRTGDDEKKITNGRSRLNKLRKNEEFQEFYRTLITEWSTHNIGRALTRLSSQIDDKNPWVANKAANDILSQSKKFMTGNDENSVVVKFEGMPELGEPGED